MTSTLDRLFAELRDELGFDPIEGNESPNGLEYGREGRKYYWTSRWATGNVPIYNRATIGERIPGFIYEHVTFGSRDDSQTVRQARALLAALLRGWPPRA